MLDNIVYSDLLFYFEDNIDIDSIVVIYIDINDICSIFDSLYCIFILISILMFDILLELIFLLRRIILILIFIIHIYNIRFMLYLYWTCIVFILELICIGAVSICIGFGICIRVVLDRVFGFILDFYWICIEFV